MVVPMLVIFMVLILVFYLTCNCIKKEGFHDPINDELPVHLNPWVSNPEVNKIIEAVIHKINCDIQQKLQIGRVDSVVKDIDDQGNDRYIIDVFTYHMNKDSVNDVDIRLILDVSRIKDSNNLQINTIKFSNAQKVSDPVVHPIESDNPDNLLIKPSNTGNDYKHKTGRQISSLDHAVFENPAESGSNPADNNKWILSNQIQDPVLRRFPCFDQGDWWDIHGVELNMMHEQELKKTLDNLKHELLDQEPVYKPPKTNSPWCYLTNLNASTSQRYINAEAYPTKVEARTPGQYKWMNDLTNNIMGFPHGSSGQTGR